MKLHKLLLISTILICTDISFSRASEPVALKSSLLTPAPAGTAGYNTALGLRFGFEGGLTFKHFIAEDRVIEAIVSRGWKYGGLRITGLYEFQKAIPDVEGLSWFVGLGAHVGFWDDEYYFRNGSYKWGYSSGGRYTSIGVDGILGLEYKLPDVPFAASLDIKPFMDLIGRGDRFGDGALSLRYTF